MDLTGNKMTNISLSIIIVNYNTFKLTRDTINSCISEPTRYTYEIFLVDNKSTDDSLFQLKEYFKKEISRGTIKVIENEENKGFANANNLAIEKSQGDFVLLLNSAIPQAVTPQENVKNLKWEVSQGTTAGRQI